MISNNVKRFCCEDISLIENYNEAINDDSQVWSCHHRLETHYSDGRRRSDEKDLLIQDLISLGLYYNRPAKELIFLTNSEHAKVHQKTRDERITKDSEIKRINSINEFWNSDESVELKRQRSEQLRNHNVNTVMNPETREKLRVSHLRENLSLETLQKMSSASKNRIRKPHSEATKQKMREKAKLRWTSDEYKLKQHNSHLGNCHSEDERKYISQRVQESMTEDVRKRISDSAKNHVCTNEQKQKIREKLTGRKFTPETIEKMSVARRKYWENKKKNDSDDKYKLF